MNSNPLITLQGFDYLYEQLKDQNNSKRVLTGLRDALYQEQIDRIPEEDMGRKQTQIKTLLHILKTINFTGDILEVGCGDGQLSKVLAEEYPCKITAIDHNEKLIEKNKRKNKRSNLSYTAKNAFQYQPRGRLGIVIGLHCCGDLTDRLIDLAISAHANLLCFPCCYGKLKQQRIQMPRSQLLSQRREQFQDILERASFLEGYVDERETARPNVILEIYRRMVDFDRLFYLRENHHDPYFIRANTPGFNSSLRTAIIT